jgi:hypothetical protein
MDYFALFLDSLCLIVGHGVMHMVFISRLTGKKQRPSVKSCVSEIRQSQVWSSENRVE